MKVHAIDTGTVRVHERQRRGEGRGLARFVRTLLDREWTPPLPIHAWLIDHPEGPIVVDTGETARVERSGYFPRWHPYYRVAVRERVEPFEEIGPRLSALGIPPESVRLVVMTHLHTDHAGGLHHFPDAEVVVSRTEWAAARGLAGKVRGYLPHRWPGWLAPTLVDPPELRGDGADEGVPLTRDGRVRLVATPGHTAGHASVLVEDGARTLFLAGDASYTEANLLAGRVDGVSSLGGGEAAAAETLRRIRRLAASRPLVYLPSHDPEAAARLAGRRPVDAARVGRRAA